jgi:hypothetical protein
LAEDEGEGGGTVVEDGETIHDAAFGLRGLEVSRASVVLSSGMTPSNVCARSLFFLGLNDLRFVEIGKPKLGLLGLGFSFM